MTPSGFHYFNHFFVVRFFSLHRISIKGLTGTAIVYMRKYSLDTTLTKYILNIFEIYIIMGQDVYMGESCFKSQNNRK